MLNVGIFVWGLYDAVLARTVNPVVTKKGRFLCDLQFYRQLHVNSKRAEISQLGPSQVCPLRNSNIEANFP